MKKNRILGLALTAFAVVGLASCGSKSDDTISVWATAAEQEVVEEVLKEYNATASKEDQIKITYTAVAESDCGTTLAKDPTVNGAPALFLTADDHLYNLINLGIAAEIKGTRAEKVKTLNTDASVQAVTSDDKIYGYPVTNDNGYFLWYNSEALSDVSSLESILETAKASGKKVLMDVANGWYANSFIMSPEACGTTSLYWTKTDNGVKYTTTWDNEVGVKVSEYIASLLTPYYADGTLVTGGNDNISAGFADGTLIAAVSGTWMENDIKNAMKSGGGTMAAAKLPSYHIDNKAYQMASFSGAKFYGINRTRPAEEQKKAATLAELLTSKEAQLKRFKIRQTLPCNKEAAADSEYVNNNTVGGKALEAQTAYTCVQAKTAQDRYWDIGKAIGQAYIDSKLGEAGTWSKFLNIQCELLRKEG